MLKCPGVRHLEQAKERMGRKHYGTPESSKFSIKYQILDLKSNIEWADQKASLQT